MPNFAYIAGYVVSPHMFTTLANMVLTDKGVHMRGLPIFHTGRLVFSSSRACAKDGCEHITCEAEGLETSYNFGTTWEASEGSVWTHGNTENTSRFGHGQSQKRSFTYVLFSMIVMLRDSKPSSAHTVTSLTFVHISGDRTLMFSVSHRASICKFKELKVEPNPTCCCFSFSSSCVAFPIVAACCAATPLFWSIHGYLFHCCAQIHGR